MLTLQEHGTADRKRSEHGIEPFRESPVDFRGDQNIWMAQCSINMMITDSNIPTALELMPTRDPLDSDSRWHLMLNCPITGLTLSTPSACTTTPHNELPPAGLEKIHPQGEVVAAHKPDGRAFRQLRGHNDIAPRDLQRGLQQVATTKPRLLSRGSPDDAAPGGGGASSSAPPSTYLLRGDEAHVLRCVVCCLFVSSGC